MPSNLASSTDSPRRGSRQRTRRMRDDHIVPLTNQRQARSPTPELVQEQSSAQEATQPEQTLVAVPDSSQGAYSFCYYVITYADPYYNHQNGHRRLVFAIR
jgi:hypothetical protein